MRGPNVMGVMFWVMAGPLVLGCNAYDAAARTTDRVLGRAAHSFKRWWERQ